MGNLHWIPNRSQTAHLAHSIPEFVEGCRML